MATLVAAGQEKVTPVQKVIGMLNDMLAKGQKEKDEEQVRFATYQQFCESTEAEKTRNIASGKSAIDQLHAAGEKAGADAMVAAGEIAKLGGDIDEWSGQRDEANQLRAKDKADYEVVHADYSNAMDAVERALNVLRSSPGQSFAQVKPALLQLQSLDRVPAKAKQVIVSFLQRTPTEMIEEGIMGAPEAAHFESSSGGVINMVEELGDKFKAERYDLEKEEAKKAHAGSMIAQGFTDNIERASRENGEKEAFMAQRTKDQAQAQGDHADTVATLAADEQFLSDLTTECKQKASDFASRQELRAGEIVAVSKAIEIMSGSAVGGGTQHLPSLVQDAIALVQLRSNAQSPLQGRVAVFLKERAVRQNSRMLSLIAARVADDPFNKVKKMIEDMVTKLMEEANEEAEHKGFCDTEMGTNQNTRDAKTAGVEKLTAKIEELNADIKQLAEEVSELGAAVAASDAAVAEASALRSAEHAKNVATIADARVAGEATARALTVLKEFYGKASGATALLMFGSSVPGAPETFSKPYTGMGGSNTGVVGMLEVIQSDFVRLDTETTDSEDKAARAQEEFLRDSSKDKAVKSADIKAKTNHKTQCESDLETSQKDLKGTQAELDAALEYYEKLKPSCVDAVETYEERVARRNEEVESLKDAFKILSGEDIA